MRCARHPNVETNLRCGKCDTPICPRCMVQTPVGARCPKCARVHKLPTFRISTRHYLIAMGIGLGMAIVCGVVWGLVAEFFPFFYLNFLLAAGAGYAIGEVVSLSVNRKRGSGLAVVASVAVVISYVISVWFTGFLLGVPFLLAFHFSVLNVAVTILALAIGIFITVTRLR